MLFLLPSRPKRNVCLRESKLKREIHGGLSIILCKSYPLWEGAKSVLTLQPLLARTATERAYTYGAVIGGRYWGVFGLLQAGGGRTLCGAVASFLFDQLFGGFDLVEGDALCGAPRLPHTFGVRLPLCLAFFISNRGHERPAIVGN